MAFRSKAQRAINGCSLDKRCNAVCGTPWKRPAGEFVRAPGLRCVLWKGNNHSLQDAPYQTNLQCPPTSQAFLMPPIEPFPPLECANQYGLLAIGGDLTVERLMLAYRSGIFPWFNPGEPILWWSPDPRSVIFPENFEPSRSLRKSIRNRGYRFTLNKAFEDVITQCAAPRKNESDTWITDDMHQAYINLHHQGVAHSAETWLDDKLVGGLYGIAMGKVFFGESMFSRSTDASKVALAHLVAQLRQWHYTMIDCQVSSVHITSLGAVEIPRTEFIKRLESALSCNNQVAEWPACGQAKKCNKG